MTDNKIQSANCRGDAGGAGWNLTRAGKEVAVVERQWACGSCAAAAFPAKNKNWSVRVTLTRNGSAFGTMSGSVSDARGKGSEHERDKKRVRATLPERTVELLRKRLIAKLGEGMHKAWGGVP
jgi:hypothetical protein